MQRYARGRLLAQGVFGDVYEAWDGETSTHVAVKHVREPSPAALRAAGGGGGGGPSPGVASRSESAGGWSRPGLLPAWLPGTSVGVIPRRSEIDCPAGSRRV